MKNELFTDQKVPVPIDSSQKSLLYDLFRLSHVRATFADRLLLQKSSGKTALHEWAFEILVGILLQKIIFIIFVILLFLLLLLLYFERNKIW